MSAIGAIDSGMTGAMMMKPSPRPRFDRPSCRESSEMCACGSGADGRHKHRRRDWRQYADPPEIAALITSR